MSLPDTARSPAIAFRDVSFSLESRFQVFDGFTLTVAPGERCLIACASGSGTSFFGRLALGLFRPASGSVEVLGTEVSSAPVGALMVLRRRIGFIFRDARLIGNLDVEHNIALPLNYHRMLPPVQVHRRVEQLMGMLDLQDSRRVRPAGLTSEQRMRTAIGRSFSVAPEVLLYDNPFAGYSDDVASGLVSDVDRLMAWTADVRVDGNRPSLLYAATETIGLGLLSGRFGSFRDGRVVMNDSSPNRAD